MAKHSIFISYAHEDESYKDELRKKLRIWELQKELDIELWVDEKIAGGQDTVLAWILLSPAAVSIRP